MTASFRSPRPFVALAAVAGLGAGFGSPTHAQQTGPTTEPPPAPAPGTSAPLSGTSSGAESASDVKPATQPLGGVGFTLRMYEPDPPAPPASDAAGGGDTHELAKQLQNPIANLVSVPFQFNYDRGIGPKDADRWTLNIQPVIPFSVSEEWNLITRTIVPVISQESIADGLDSDLGLGDTTQSFFFSPKAPVGGWILGGGPVALWPTGTEPRLRSESLGFGPTFVALKQDSGWTYGALANHIWSVTNSDDHEQVNSTFLQPFLSYTWPTATTVAINTESSYNWTNEEWTVPLHLLVRQVARPWGQPMQFELAATYYADAPDQGPEGWGLRFAITFVFPK